MGGMHGFGAVVTPGSDAVAHEAWELRVFAISTLVGIEGLGAGSGRAIREEMEPAEYLRAGYYERWLWSTEQRLSGAGPSGRRRSTRGSTVFAREIRRRVAGIPMPPAGPLQRRPRPSRSRRSPTRGSVSAPRSA